MEEYDNYWNRERVSKEQNQIKTKLNILEITNQQVI